MFRTPIIIFYNRFIEQTIFLQFLYYYQVPESEFGYPILQVLDKQILRINRPQSGYYRATPFHTARFPLYFYFITCKLKGA